MIDWLKELAWAITHDADTQIIVSIVISLLALTISVATIVLKVSGR